MSSKKIINNKWSFWIVIINIIYVFIGSYLYSISNITQKDFMLGFIPFIIINIIYGIISYKKNNYNKKMHILMLMILIMGIISTIFAYNREVALFGFRNRHEGLIAIIYYLSLMFISSFVSKKDRIKIVYVILFTGVIQTIYSILQIYEVKFVQTLYNYRYIIDDNKKMDVIKDVWASGFLLNPNFFGAYALICLTYSIGFYIDYEKDNIWWLIGIYLLIILFTIGLLISNAVSCVIGLGLSLLYALYYTIKKKKINKIIIVLILLIFTSFLVVKAGKTTLVRDVSQTGNETKEIVKGKVKDSFGTKRIYIWRKTLEIVPKHLLHGVGIDNFYYAFDGKPLISYKKDFAYDKAHNDYLQILITEGVIALALYLLMYFNVVVSAIKREYFIYVIGVIGYLIQAFFNISVIGLTPIFYVMMGLCIVSEGLVEDNKNDKKRKKS